MKKLKISLNNNSGSEHTLQTVNLISLLDADTLSVMFSM